MGMSAVGLYRTELLYLVEKEPPTRQTLTHHYQAVLAQAGGAPVAFRLLHADSSLGLGWLHAGREPNPALGRGGVRALLAREEVLRRQLQAVMRAAVEGPASLIVPFVTDVGELRRVKEILFEERLELKKTGEPFREKLPVGVVLETPASILGVQDLARECDFLVLALDSCLQHLLAVDRENSDLAGWFETLHPFVMRAVGEVARVCDDLGKPLSVFGFTATQPHNLPFLVGLGLRRFLVPPIGLRDFLSEIAQIDARTGRRAARAAQKASCQVETLSLVDGYRHGYAR
jgi:phosphoenolpyruvate-protein kinase (PTS system EI component)